MFYKLNGKTPVLCSAEEMGVWMEENRRTLACEKHGDFTTSTIFLGVDHGSGINAFLFETTVFKNYRAIETQKYSTWEDAEKGHQALVKKYA